MPTCGDDQLFHVLARRRDGGGRWDLDAVELPGVHAEVGDLGDGALSIRSVIADAMGEDRSDIRVRILLC